MPILKIDNREIKVPEGLSVLGAARMLGIHIPTMCYREGKPHFTSCMMCMVKDRKTGKLFPSCSVKAVEDMDIISRDKEVEESRRMALDLLLSEHVGDCEAPCQVTCPAHMNIPLMNRLLAEGAFLEAVKVVKKDIALPAVFGRICPAPCEGACRRKGIDSAVSICLLKRYAGDHLLKDTGTWRPDKAESSGKKVAVIGGGPAGLAAAWYLQLKGHACTVYDRRTEPGGTLWREVDSGNLPAEILRKEVGLLEQEGVRFMMKKQVDRVLFDKITEEYDAVLVAAGSMDKALELGIGNNAAGTGADKNTYRIGDSKIFAAGSVLRPSKLAIRTLGQGKEASYSMDQFLRGEPVTGEYFMFNSRFGKLQEAEFAEYLKESITAERNEPEDSSEGFTAEQVKTEAARCLHCDCRAVNDCKLRTFSDEYKASQKRFWSEERKPVRKVVQHNSVVYEPSKCIKCGICVRIAEEFR